MASEISNTSVGDKCRGPSPSRLLCHISSAGCDALVVEIDTSALPHHPVLVEGRGNLRFVVHHEARSARILVLLVVPEEANGKIGDVAARWIR